MIDKRRHKRVTIEGVFGSVMFASNTEIVNLSLSGAALHLGVNLKLGKEYTIRLETEKNKIIELKGVAVWSVLSGSRKGQYGDVIPIYYAGIEFTNVFSEQSSELVNFIEEHRIKGTEDRLKGLRFKIHSPGKSVSLDYSFGYRVKLISLGGMLMETIQEFKLEDRFPMELFLGTGKTIKFIGRVASCIKVPDKQPTHYDIGVEFFEMAGEDKAELEKFINNTASGKKDTAQ